MLGGLKGLAMAIQCDEFWSSNHYQHPPLNDEMIEIAERELGVRLPAEYIALLRIQNGGYTRGFRFPMTQPTTWSEDYIGLNDLSGIVLNPKIPTPLNILETLLMTEEWSLPPRLVLLSGDGHFWIALDYRASDIPSVVWIDTECNEDLQVASSFAAFLDGLLPGSAFNTKLEKPPDTGSTGRG
jgi:hypothetical protein